MPTSHSELPPLAESLASPAPARGVGWWVWCVAAYVGAILVGRVFAVSAQQWASFSPAVAVLFAVLLRAPRAQWVAILAAALAINAGLRIGVFRWDALQSAASFLADGVFCVAAAWALLVLRPVPFQLHSLRSVLTLVAVSLASAMLLGGPLGVFTVVERGAQDFWEVWLHWVLARAVSVLILLPLLLAFADAYPVVFQHRWGKRAVEGAFLYLSLLASSITVYYGNLTYLSLPTLLLLWSIWAVLRFGGVGVSLAMLIITVVSIIATLAGKGAFIRPGREVEDSMLRLLSYTAIWGGFFQLVAAILRERQTALNQVETMNRELEGRVSERTRSLEAAHEALRASEERFRLAAAAASFGAYDYNLLENTLHWTREMKIIHGVPVEEEITAERARGFFRPNEVAEIEDIFRKSLDPLGPRTLIIECAITRVDGVERYVRLSGRTLVEERDGRLVAVRAIGTCTDITERKHSEQALRDSEHRLALAVRAGRSGTYEYNLKTDTNLWSDDLLELYGMKRAEFTGALQDWQQAVVQEDLPTAMRALEESMNSGHFSTRFRIRRRDSGELRWLDARGTWYRDKLGQPERLIGINVDVTEHTRVEEALRESENQLKFVLEAAEVGTWGLDLPDGRLSVSEDFRIQFGVEPTEIFGRLEQWEHRLHPADLPIHRKALEKAIGGAGPYQAEYRVLWPEGSVRWLMVRGQVTQGSLAEGGLHLSGISLDVTSRRRTEEALRGNAQRQEALVELTRYILTTRLEPAALAKAVFLKICPVMGAEIGFMYRLNTERQRLELLGDTGLALAEEARAHELAPEEVLVETSLEAEMVGVEGQETPPPFLAGLHLRAYSCHPLVDSAGRVLGTLSVGSRERGPFEPEEDDFLQTLCHFLALTWERSAAESAVLKAKESAELANRTKDDFLAALSHELRTPLNPVLLLTSELQRSEELPAAIRPDIDSIRRHVELEARLIDDLLDLTRITRGKTNLQLTPCSAHRLLRQALEILESDRKDKNIQVELQLEAKAEHVLADAVRLQQVFWNILRNAIKFTPAGGKVTVRTQSDALRQIKIIVTDTGPGIPPAQLEKIFQVFHQGEGGHRFGGLGLGLAIARSLVEMHHGTIRAESAGYNRGASFTISLPVLTDAVPLDDHASPSTPEPMAMPVSGLRILLVEDHEATRVLLSRLLKRRHHEVFAAGSVAGARQLLEDDVYDLLISDLGLPDGDGADLMRECAARGGPPGIALSGYGMDHDLQRTAGAGFLAHLIKPVDIQSLERAIEQVIRRN